MKVSPMEERVLKWINHYAFRGGSSRRLSRERDSKDREADRGDSEGASETQRTSPKQEFPLAGVSIEGGSPGEATFPDSCTIAILQFLG